MVHEKLRHGDKPLWFSILTFVLPLVLAIAAGYGTVKFTDGRTQKAIDSLEAKQAEQQKTNERFMTRDELKLFMESTTRELNEIHNDVRELRRDLRRQ